jgi:hypothetical protein
MHSQGVEYEVLFGGKTLGDAAVACKPAIGGRYADESLTRMYGIPPCISPDPGRLQGSGINRHDHRRVRFGRLLGDSAAKRRNRVSHSSVSPVWYEGSPAVYGLLRQRSLASESAIQLVSLAYDAASVP